MEHFAGRLREATQTFGPLCVGFDPSSALLQSAFGADDVDALRRFCDVALAGAAGVVGVIKPQVAFFERFGARGFAVLEDLCRDARDAKLVVIGDAKRGDISTTADAYAAAWVGRDAPFEVDAVTITPYLGVDALSPITAAAAATGRGTFVVVASSNPEGRSVQGATVGDTTVERTLLAAIGSANASASGSIGAVIGVTRTFELDLLDAMGGPILVPGFGAQGGSAAQVRANFAGCAHPIVVAASRAWTDAGLDAPALAARARMLNGELANALG